MKIVAILAAYNEERFIARSLEHLIGQGLEVHLCDNDSTDRTVALAEPFLGKGLREIERIPRTEGVHPWPRILQRKEELSVALEGDWFLHADPDEIHLPPAGYATLHDAVSRADADGYNAINFVEFTFLPTQEAPDHEHEAYDRTMRHYYPFLPSFPHRLNLWKKHPLPLGLAESGGHLVDFPGLRLWPESGRMKHYLFLSVAHALEKYGKRRHDPAALARGWHGWRARVFGTRGSERPDLLALPQAGELRHAPSDADLDASQPLARHPWMEDWVRRIGELDDA